MLEVTKQAFTSLLFILWVLSILSSKKNQYLMALIVFTDVLKKIQNTFDYFL